MAVYSALDDMGLDMDLCGLRPIGMCWILGRDAYVTHTLARCVMDGFGLFARYGDQGREITNTHLG